MPRSFQFTLLAVLLCAFGPLQSQTRPAADVIPPPDESHANKPIGVCGARHFDARLELCDTRDNRLYRLTRIGSQTWMAENLDYGQMIPGNSEQTRAGQKYCLFDMKSDCAALYQWAEAMGLDPGFNSKAGGETQGSQGICPAGWRLPSSADWQQLLSLVRNEQGAQNVAVSLMAYSPDDHLRWKSNTSPDDMLPAHDRYGMSIVPTGQRVLQGTCPDGPATDSFFCSAHDEAKFWTSDEAPADAEVGVTITLIEDIHHVIDSSKPFLEGFTPEEKQAWRQLAERKASEQSVLQRGYRNSLKQLGMAVRCIKD